ncbi:hypothetical protein lbkm_3347 [Lachnospiraceae bacterium KM106-2]|nr:hypothetical protein lbkm_3347 [Lachnospiraceae bacterium KM106-2]
MRILILGGSGYVGQAIWRRLQMSEDVYGTYHTKRIEYKENEKMFFYDLVDQECLKQILVTVRPQVIISCLRGDYSLQLKAHEKVAMYLAENDGKIIYFSTANVFDAKKDKPHYEMDETGSETDYGKFKIQCETLLNEKLGTDCVIVRIPAVWGKGCPRILKLKEYAKYQNPIQTYENIATNYTLDTQIASWIEYIIRYSLKGTFHIGTEDTYDYTRFQVELANKLKLETLVLEKEVLPELCYQAVLPGREEIPKELRLTVKDVIAYLKEVEKGE